MWPVFWARVSYITKTYAVAKKNRFLKENLNSELSCIDQTNVGWSAFDVERQLSEKPGVECEGLVRECTGIAQKKKYR